MARTNKTMTSKEADDHLARLEKLRKDAEKQLKHINKVREKKGLPPMKRMTPEVLEDVVLRNSDAAADKELVKDSELVQDGDLITGLRVYTRSADGPVGRRVEGEELCAVHSLTKRVRECYRELDGAMVRVGEVTGTRKGNVGTRKDLQRKAPGILKSIMVRLMPHEAEVTGAELKRLQIEAAMDRTAAAFEAETGCEVISAVVHRMSATDLHIHLQYTLVHQVQESKSMLGRRMAPWKLLASKLAREALEAEGGRPSPVAIHKKKLELIEAGVLEPQPEAGVEFHKRKGLRSLGDGSILGYSFRQKLNLVRLAEDGGEAEVAADVTALNDGRGGFAPIARKSDKELDGKYLDLWLERTWRRNVTDELPEDSRARLVEAGVEAARNYAAFGTTLVEEAHVDKKMQEIADQSKLLATAVEGAAAVDAELRKRATDLEIEAKRLREDRGAFEASRAAVEAEHTRLTVRITKLEKAAEIAKALKERFKAFMLKIMNMPAVLTLLRDRPAVKKSYDGLIKDLDLNSDIE